MSIYSHSRATHSATVENWEGNEHMSTIGWLTPEGDEVCDDCAGPSGPFAGDGYCRLWDEVDTPRHCEDCGALLDVALTEDGLCYVADYVTRDLESQGHLGEVTAQWAYAYPGFERYMPQGYNPETQTLN